MLYDVFLWLLASSEAAEVYAQIEMPNAEAAVQETMAAHGLPWVCYAWVVPQDDGLPTAEFHEMSCAFVGHETGG